MPGKPAAAKSPKRKQFLLAQTKKEKRFFYQQGKKAPTNQKKRKIDFFTNVLTIKTIQVNGKDLKAQDVQNSQKHANSFSQAKCCSSLNTVL